LLKSLFFLLPSRSSGQGYWSPHARSVTGELIFREKSIFGLSTIEPFVLVLYFNSFKSLNAPVAAVLKLLLD
jgi:hypothetical protein